MTEGTEKEKLQRKFRAPDSSLTIPYDGKMGKRIEDNSGVLSLVGYTRCWQSKSDRECKSRRRKLGLG